jgi:hypothetical protein
MVIKNMAKIEQKDKFNLATIDQGVGYAEMNSATAKQMV